MLNLVIEQVVASAGPYYLSSLEVNESSYLD